MLRAYHARMHRRAQYILDLEPASGSADLATSWMKLDAHLAGVERICWWQARPILTLKPQEARMFV
jgi:hypothetical protein